MDPQNKPTISQKEGSPCASDYLRSAEMTEVMMNTPTMDEIGLNNQKDSISYQIFPDPSDYECICKLKDRLPSIVVEPTEGEVESGELRWPPEEFVVHEDGKEKKEEKEKENKEQ
ncbi:protein LBH isoform X1 [Monodelphis domestica]|nr:protein LBH isoform X1 [Monodelphis domestica]XP_056669204.1 protein LBH isoform X1 [Monodelphis domestica]XP_056669205.1 protein LBH isoform X1 [Monodelphis domestica]